MEDPDLGTLCFLCDIDGSAPGLVVRPRDALRKKLFIASLGVEVISEAGRIESVSVSATKITVTFETLHSQPLVSVLRLRVEQTAVVSGSRPALTIAPTTTPAPAMTRGAWEFQPQGALQTTAVELSVAKSR